MQNGFTRRHPRQRLCRLPRVPAARRSRCSGERRAGTVLSGSVRRCVRVLTQRVVACVLQAIRPSASFGSYSSVLRSSRSTGVFSVGACGRPLSSTNGEMAKTRSVKSMSTVETVDTTSTLGVTSHRGSARGSGDSQRTSAAPVLCRVLTSDRESLLKHLLIRISESGDKKPHTD